MFRSASLNTSLLSSPAAVLGKSGVFDAKATQRRRSARGKGARPPDIARQIQELELPSVSFPQLLPSWINAADNNFTRSIATVHRVFGLTMALCMLAVIFPGTQIPLGQKVFAFLYIIFATVVTYQSRTYTKRQSASTLHSTGFVLFTVGNAAFSLWVSNDLMRALFWVLWLPGTYVERATICGPKDWRPLLATVSLLAVASASYLLWANLDYSLAARLLLLIPVAHVGSISLLYMLSTMGDQLRIFGRGRTALVKAREAAERKSNAEHVATQLQLERINRSLTLGALAASIAHEINQPLASIVTNAAAAARWLREEHLDLDEARQAIARVVQDGHRAGAIIASFRAVLSEGEPPQRTLLQGNALVKEALDILEPEMQKRAVVVLTPTLEDLPSIRGDHVQLRQVFLNLITNALDAMVEVIDRPRLLIIRCEREGDMGVISVEDSGPGIGVKDPKRIFEAFFTTKPSGMGMGLFICRMIVEAHGGALKVESRPGRTKFYVRLPVGSHTRMGSAR